MAAPSVSSQVLCTCGKMASIAFSAMARKGYHSSRTAFSNGNRFMAAMRCGPNPRHIHQSSVSLIRRDSTPNLSLSQASLSNAELQDTDAVDAPQAPASEQASSAIEPLHHPDYFGVADMFTLRDLFDARVHLGHRTGRTTASMTPYLYGARQDSVVIDLRHTVTHLRAALNVTAHVAYRGGIILLVHRNAANAHLVDRAARDAGEYSHTHRWVGQILTDAKEYFRIDVRLPDLIVFLSTQSTIFETHVAVRDAAKMSVPTVGVVDSDCDPALVTWPVPGNDDTPSAVALYCRLFRDAILRGKAVRKEHMGEAPNTVVHAASGVREEAPPGDADAAHSVNVEAERS